jgi:integrase
MAAKEPRPEALPENVTPLRPRQKRQTRVTNTEATTPKPPRSWGLVDRLPSGNYRARYPDPSYKGKGRAPRLAAPTTFQSKGDAEAWLSLKQAEVIERRWKPASAIERDKVTFEDYAAHFMKHRDLSPKTRREYQRQLDGRLATFNPFTLDEINPGMVKQWFDDQDVRYPTARKKAYEVLHVILATASRPDEDTDAPPLIDSNPARLTAKTLNRRPVDSMPKKSAKVKPASLEELAAIMNALPERYRLMVLIAAWCAPRFGELTELRRKDITIERDKKGKLEAGILHISRAVTWPDPDTPIVKEPKSEAGVRDVEIPPHILTFLVDHLDKWAEQGENGLLFPAVDSPGQHMKHGALYKVYRRARKVAGRMDLRWHDLRHTGATLAAQQGATLADLMNRLGHSTVDAAMIYQHSSAERDREIARRLSVLATSQGQPSDESARPPSATA